MKLLEFCFTPIFYFATNLTWTLKTISQSLVMLSAQRADVGRSFASRNKNIYLKCRWPQESEYIRFRIFISFKLISVSLFVVMIV